MTMNEKLQRYLWDQVFIPLVSVGFSGVWYTLSIIAYVIGQILPSTRTQMPPSTPPRRSNSTTTRPAAKPIMAPLPSILAPKGDSPQHHVRFPSAVPQPPMRPRATKRWSSPAGFADLPLPREVPAAEKHIHADGTSCAAACINKLLPQLSLLEQGNRTPSISSTIGEDELEPSLSRSSSISMTRKTSLSSKLPSMKVFRNLSKREKSEGSHSRSSSVSSSVASTPPSTPPVVVMELRPDPEKGSTSTTSSADHPSRSGFPHTFKFRPKRASASATMFASADKARASEALHVFHQTPSPPPSPDRETEAPSVSRSQSHSRRKAFATYLNLSIQTHHDSPSNSPRTAVDSSFPISAQHSAFTPTFTPATPRSRALCPRKSSKTPTGPAPRTQPYGYPYFAMMPNGEYADIPPELQKSAKRRSFGGSAPHSRSNSMDETGAEKLHIERSEAPSAVTPTNSLGLEMLQQSTPRPTRRHFLSRHLASEGAIS